MDRLERLQAVIAEQRRRWTEKYGWVQSNECRPLSWFEEMEANAQREMIREYKVFMRQHLAALYASEDEDQRNNLPS